ncbi:MAG: hydrogenase maturation nickel metallochaperone HypA, partial [Actinomycetota bacterium]|nr:hydrogenase maturation nickel metallochaperone HypA [Actinomycetota bacterium]
MHELAIAESVVSSVLERTEGHHVKVVRLRIGRLAGVVPDALTFCFELAAAG